MQTRRTLLLIALLLLLIAAAPTRPPTVTLTKSDNTTVRGQVQTIDPKSVTIQTLVKNEPGEALTIPWSEIKSLSNGMTRQRAIQLHKKDHPDDLCTDCRGTVNVSCPTCKGTGREHASANDCPTCHGEQLAACKAPKCDKGKIPCPKPCLKPTDGGWFKKPDGKMWKRFSVSGGTGEVSDSHLGEILGPGGPTPCELCHKAMKIDCPKCHGTGLAAPCETCTAAAKANPCKDCQRGEVACKTCGGLGLKPEVTGFTATPDPAATPPTAAPPGTPQP